MSASCRPTWAISDTGRKAEIDTSTSSGSIQGGIQPCSTSGAPSAATASPPRPGGDLQPGGLRRQVREQAQPLGLVAVAPLP